MATAQMIRKKTKISKEVEQFLQNFPNAQKSYTESTSFVKKLVAMSVSGIAYKYNVFPKSYFFTRSFCGLNVKILHGDRDVQVTEANQIIRWMDGVNDAIEKRFLKKMVVGLSSEDNEPSEVNDTFTFNFRYDKEGAVSMEQVGSGGHAGGEQSSGPVDPEKLQQIVTSTICMLANSTELTTTQYAAHKSFINFKLYYTKETPEDYEPPYFCTAETENFEYRNGSHVKVGMGRVGTPWHTVILQLATSDTSVAEPRTPENQIMAEHQEPARSPQNELSKSELDRLTGKMVGNWEFSNTVARSQDKYGEVPLTSPTMPLTSPTLLTVPLNSPMLPLTSPTLPASAVSTTGSKAASLPSDETIHCPCLNELGGLLVRCNFCDTWQHAICYGQFAEEPQGFHHCEGCAQSLGVACSDPRLAGLGKDEQQVLCLFRQALAVCDRVRRVDAATLSLHLPGVEDFMVQHLVKMLTSNGILDTKRGKLSKSLAINRDRLKSVQDEQLFQSASAELDEAMETLSTSSPPGTPKEPPKQQGKKKRSRGEDQEDKKAAPRKRFKVSEPEPTARPRRACSRSRQGKN